jgi:hypothetical protein
VEGVSLRSATSKAVSRLELLDEPSSRAPFAQLNPICASVVAVVFE